MIIGFVHYPRWCTRKKAITFVIAFFLVWKTDRPNISPSAQSFNYPVSAVSFSRSHFSPLAILFGLCYNNSRKLSFVR